MTQKVCTGCGETKDEREFRWHGSTKSGRTRYQRCKPCDREDHKKYHGKNRPELLAKMRARRIAERSTLDGFLRYLLRAKRDWCRSKNVPCTITLEYLLELYEWQKGRCCLTWRTLEYGPGKRKANRLSLDRIESRYGYVPGNIRLVILHVNIARSEYGDRELLELARDLSRADGPSGDLNIPFHAKHTLPHPVAWDWSPRIVQRPDGTVEFEPKHVWLAAVGLEEGSDASAREICSAIARRISGIQS